MTMQTTKDNSQIDTIRRLVEMGLIAQNDEPKPKAATLCATTFA